MTYVDVFIVEDDFAEAVLKTEDRCSQNLCSLQSLDLTLFMKYLRSKHPNCLDGRIVDAYMEKSRAGAWPGARSYQKNDADKAILRKTADFCVSAGDNSMYELFYYANCRSIGRGLHGSCWPDMLHVVLKGIVEKTLAWSLAIVYGIHRLAGDEWETGMAVLDARVANFPNVPNLPGIR